MSVFRFRAFGDPVPFEGWVAGEDLLSASHIANEFIESRGGELRDFGEPASDDLPGETRVLVGRRPPDEFVWGDLEGVRD